MSNTTQTQALEVYQDKQAAIVRIAPEVLARRDELLSATALVVKVDTPEQQRVAVQMQADVHELASEIEKARRLIKEPYLEICRSIDAVAREAVGQLNAEKIRLAELVGSYQQQLEDRRRQIEREQQAERERLEREAAEAKAAADAKLQAELAAAKSEADRRAAELAAEAEKQRIADLVEQNKQAYAPPPPAPKEQGQLVRRQWAFRITNDFELLRGHPDWVRRIEWDRLRIKEFLNSRSQDLEQGKLQIPGLEVTAETISTIRRTKGPVVDV